MVNKTRDMTAGPTPRIRVQYSMPWSLREKNVISIIEAEKIFFYHETN